MIQSKKLALGLHTRTQRVEAGSAVGAKNLWGGGCLTQSTQPTSHDKHDAHTHTHTHLCTHTHTYSHAPAARGEETKLLQTVNHLSWRGNMRFFFFLAVLLIKS